MSYGSPAERRRAKVRFGYLKLLLFSGILLFIVPSAKAEPKPLAETPKLVDEKRRSLLKVIAALGLGAGAAYAAIKSPLIGAASKATNPAPPSGVYMELTASGQAAQLPQVSSLPSVASAGAITYDSAKGREYIADGILGQWRRSGTEALQDIYVSPVGISNGGSTEYNDGWGPYGPDTPGTANMGLQQAIAAQASVASTTVAGNPARAPAVIGVSGIFTINSPVDFIAAYSGLSQDVSGLIVDLSRTLIQPATSMTEVVNLACPAGYYFQEMIFICGSIGPGAQTGIDAIRTYNLRSSRVEIGFVAGFTGGIGVHVYPAFVSQGMFFNNYCIIKEVDNCGIGVLLDGTTGSYGAQGNQIVLQHAINCTTGLQIDKAVGDNSNLNTFFIGVIEHGTTGVLDYNGLNIYYYNDGNSNSTADYVLASSAGNVPYIRGFLQSGTPVILNGGEANYENIVPGSLPPRFYVDDRAPTGTDASPITIYTTGGTAELLMLSAGSIVDGFVSGTFTYTVTFTDADGTSRHLTSTLTGSGTSTGITLVVRASAGTNVTAQVTSYGSASNYYVAGTCMKLQNT